MHELIKNNIINKKLIIDGDNILIALSGGPDSVFLFHNLRKLKDIISFNLYASHINHMYRGKDAMHDEEFVRDLCQKYGVRLFVKRKNAAEYAKELKVTEEEAGRVLRYGFFNENLSQIGGGKIALAHNLNDQAETVLQRLIRGTGIDGLSAMSFQKGNLIRPMLNVSRDEIMAYLHENNYQYCIDITNSQDIYGRNKIRLNLIPYLEKNFSPNIQATLSRMAEAMERDKKIIEKYIDIKFKELLKDRSGSKLVLDLNLLRALDVGERGRIIRRGIEELKGNTVNVEMKHIDNAISLMDAGKTGKKIDLTGGFTIEMSYDNFIINKGLDKVPEFEYNIALNEITHIKEVNKTLLARVFEAGTETWEDTEDKDSFCVDFDLVKGSLTVRNRRPGDSITPCGMEGSKKVKDVFIDLKIPKEERDSRLIVADDENIIWLEGYRINDKYKINESTKKILKISTGRQYEQRH
ncbi:MAG TPA: tRNA lysidine(34) synthetase TilS [Tissierellia bacterium]|nr:tRNA lysidine(34) synthetase TilS [Tissierellia bacterium]